MGKYVKLYRHIMEGGGDNSVGFLALCHLLIRMGFAHRVKGDHHIFTRDGVEEIINLQPKGSEAKPYQVKQVRGVFLKYGLGEADVD